MQENLTAAELEFIRQDLNSSTKGDNGWRTVTNPKKQRKNAQPKAPGESGKLRPNGAVTGGDAENVNVFGSLEDQSEERRKRLLEARREAIGSDSDAKVRTNRRLESEADDDSEGVENGNVKTKKVKVKKEMKLKVTVAEAAAKIDAEELSAFLMDVAGSFENQDEIQLKRLADYFGRAFAGVSSALFPWVKILRESSVAKMVDVSDVVYKTGADWINKRNLEALSSFALWTCLCISLQLKVRRKLSSSHLQNLRRKKYDENLEANVAILQELGVARREFPGKLSSLEPLKKTIKTFKQQNEKALAKKDEPARHALYKEADGCCKVILGRTSHGGHGCLKGTVVVILVLAVGAILLSPPNPESLDWNRLVTMFYWQHS